MKIEEMPEGYEVIVTNRLHGHEFAIGERVRRTKLEYDGDSEQYGFGNLSETWYLSQEEIEEIHGVTSLTSQQVKIKLLHPDANIPTRGTELSTGYDIGFVDKPISTQGLGLWKHTYKTGLAMTPPEGYGIQIRPRSSIHKKWTWIPNSPPTIDHDYTGEILIVFLSPEKTPPYIDPKEKICQMMIEPIYNLQFEEVKKLKGTERGEGGFGSTTKEEQGK